MKVRFAVAMAATLFAGALAMAADGSWTGWISDSQCGVKGAKRQGRRVHNQMRQGARC